MLVWLSRCSWFRRDARFHRGACTGEGVLAVRGLLPTELAAIAPSNSSIDVATRLARAVLALGWCGR
eukprot:7376423-Prymnesium_polylepis.2